MEHRKEERIIIRIPMEITTSFSPRPIPIITDNFCPSGAHLCPNIPLKLEERIICQFEVPGIDDPFVYDSRVVHTYADGDSYFVTNKGFGIEFINTTPMEKTAIRRALWDLVEWGIHPMDRQNTSDR